jgi:hypothetical protein
MKKYHIHVVKVVSEHEFDIEANSREEAFSIALKRPLTVKSKVKMIGPGTKKVAIAYS